MLDWYRINGPRWQPSDEYMENRLATNPCHLYDFFDEREVYVLIFRSGTVENPYYFELESGDALHPGDHLHHTRTQAEAAAFMAAFHRLEQGLNQKGK